MNIRNYFLTLASISLLAACSDDDLPDNEEINEEEESVETNHPYRLVSQIVKKVLSSQEIEYEWHFEYDTQGRIIEITPIWGSNNSTDTYRHLTFSYEDDKIIQTNSSYTWTYELNSDGNVEKLTRNRGGGSNIDIEYFIYNDEGQLTYIDCTGYDGENKEAFWEDGDMVRIEYNGGLPYVQWYFGDDLNDSAINMDFNHFLTENELTEWFIDPRCIKAFGFFGERSKHLKTGEYSGDDPMESYLTLEYEYEYDDDGYVSQIIERNMGYGDEHLTSARQIYVYEISYE